MAEKEVNSSDYLTWPTGKLDFSPGCLVMGILNVTPDSFSDGGKFFSADCAIKQGLQMAYDGASIIDIGAESTRPGSKPVSADEQIARAVPVIEKLAEQIAIPISIDARDPAVAAAAIEAGASIINDVSALGYEEMATVAAGRQVPVVLMHMQGAPETMQAEPCYDDVVAEVLDYLLARARYAEQMGIKKERIFIDPGIGFGKTLEHNLLLLKDIDKFVASGYRVVLGTSRKRFIGQLTGKEVATERMFGTAATVALAAKAGVAIVRVHDVAAMADVVKIANALR